MKHNCGLEAYISVKSDRDQGAYAEVKFDVS